MVADGQQWWWRCVKRWFEATWVLESLHNACCCLTHCFQLKASDPCRVGEGSASTVAERKRGAPREAAETKLLRAVFRSLRTRWPAVEGALHCRLRLFFLWGAPIWPWPGAQLSWARYLASVDDFDTRDNSWACWQVIPVTQRLLFETAEDVSWSWDSGGKVKEVAWKEKAGCENVEGDQECGDCLGGHLHQVGGDQGGGGQVVILVENRMGRPGTPGPRSVQITENITLHTSLASYYSC